MASNQYESHARYRKASALAETLLAAGATGASARLLSVKDRNLAAAVAKVREPSEETWALVLSIIDGREAEMTEDDVFEGLQA